MKNYIIALIGLCIIFLNQSCKDPCKGEPEAIWEPENISLKFINNNDESIFDTGYHIDSLIIIDGNINIDYSYDNDDVLRFSLNIVDHHWSAQTNIGETFFYLIFKFNHLDSDTLELYVKPKIYPDKCDATNYETIRVLFNSNTIISESYNACVFCNNITEIVKN